MRKFKGLLVSASVTAMLLSGSVVMAEEAATEAATEVATEVAQEAPAATDEVGADGLLVSDSEALKAYAQSSIEWITAMSDDDLAEIVYPSSILNVPQASMVTSVQSWQAVKEELGDLVGITDHKISVDDDNIVIESVCDFANGEGVVTTTLERRTLEMDGMNFSTGDQTMGAKMKEAVLNTLMGVCIVFLMLLFLSFLISQFKHISTFENAMKKKKEAPKPATPAPAAPVAAPVVEEEELVDDGELIAVIAAAIAAAEGTSTDGFVVRSIKKSNRNKWLRA